MATAPPAPSGSGLAADLARCVHCGFCLPACPTYVALGREPDSPRGRIHLIGALASRRTLPSPALAGHLDLCLQCRACETACPSGVPFGRIMERGRALVMERRPPMSWRLRALALREIVTRPRRLAVLFTLLRLYQRWGLRWLVRRSGLPRLLPRSLAIAEAGLPDLSSRPFRLGAMAPGPPNGTVALFAGCVMPHLYPGVHEATVRVLGRLGYAVVAPAAGGCCGALSLHAGDLETARSCARRTIDAFEGVGAAAVVVNAAGCGAAMKDYGHLLAEDPAYADRAWAFAGRVNDALAFVAERNPASLVRLPVRVTYQDSCHLAHAQGIRDAPRRLLRSIDGLELIEMENPDRCCGSAGVYVIAKPAMSLRLLDMKMQDIAATGADIVATANPGCMMQLDLGLRRAGLSGSVVHVIELVDRAMSDAGG